MPRLPLLVLFLTVACAHNQVSTADSCLRRLGTGPAEEFAELWPGTKACLDRTAPSDSNTPAALNALLEDAYCRGAIDANTALDVLSVAEAMARSSDPAAGTLAPILINQSTFLLEIGDEEGAHRAAAESVRVSMATSGPESLDVARARSELAVVLWAKGLYGEAAAELELARPIIGSSALATSVDRAHLLNRLGETRRAEGRYDEARDLLEEARLLTETCCASDDGCSPGAGLHATVLNNLAGVLKDTGGYDAALSLLAAAFRLIDPEDWGAAADASLNLAEVYRLQGNFREARRFYESALQNARRLYAEDSYEVVWFRNQLALLLQEEGLPAEAARIYGELRTFEADSGVPEFFRAQIRHDHGLALRALGEYRQADVELRTAADVRRQVLGPEHPDLGVTLAELAYTSALLPDDTHHAEARRFAAEGLSLLRAAGTYPESEARALLAEAIVCRISDRDCGYRKAEEALATVERMRHSAAGGSRAHGQFISRYMPYYERIVSWLVADGRAEDALRHVERSRARDLLDRLRLLGSDPLSDVDPALLKRIESGALEAARLHGELERSASQEEAEEIRATLGEVLLEQERLETRARAASSKWQGIVRQPDLLNRERIAALVPPGGVILVWDLGREESFVFAIGEAGAVSAYPIRDTIAGIEAMLSAGLSREAAGTRGRVVRVHGTAEAPALRRLMEVLIPARLWTSIREMKNVVVIPDGPLHRLPFDALITGGTEEKPEYWANRGVSLRYAPSLAVLASVETDPAGRPGRAPLVVGDPDHGLELSRLPGAAREAAAIAEICRRGGLPRRDPLIGPRATEAAVRNEIESAELLHMATHGLVSEDVVAMRAALVLAAPSDADGGPANDGFLTAPEIERLDLRGMELAVLSACETHIGERVEAEGVFSMGRAFLAAGSRRVIAGLWRVPDDETALLMERFYEAHLERGQSAAAALAEARSSVREIRPEPFYWAPFILIGAE